MMGQKTITTCDYCAATIDTGREAWTIERHSQLGDNRWPHVAYFCSAKCMRCYVDAKIPPAAAPSGREG